MILSAIFTNWLQAYNNEDNKLTEGKHRLIETKLSYKMIKFATRK